MAQKNPFKYHKTSPETIKIVVIYYLRYLLSYLQVEDILHKRFGLIFAGKIRSKQKGHRSNWRWHMDKVFVKINEKIHYLWKAIDHEGMVLECYFSMRRNMLEAKTFIIKAIKKHGSPKEIVADQLRSLGVAFRRISASRLQEIERYKNNQCENSHLLFRQKERSIQRSKSAITLQIFTSIQPQIYNHFNHQRGLQKREPSKPLRNESLCEWRVLCAA